MSKLGDRLVLPVTKHTDGTFHLDPISQQMFEAHRATHPQYIQTLEDTHPNEIGEYPEQNK